MLAQHKVSEARGDLGGESMHSTGHVMELWIRFVMGQTAKRRNAYPMLLPQSKHRGPIASLD